MSRLALNNNKLNVLIPFLFLGGCASSPSLISQEKLKSFSSPQELVVGLGYSSFEVGYDYLLGGYEKLTEPRLNLSQFCKINQGADFIKEVDFGFNSGAVREVKKSVTGSFGEFACISSGETLWKAEIRGKHWKSKNPVLAGGLETSRVTVTIKDKAELKAIAVRKKKIEERKKQQRLAKQAEAQRVERNRIENQRLATLKFNNATKVIKSLGDQVCTSDNLFGYIEAKSDDKIKVSIAGKVTDIDYHRYVKSIEYFFFNSEMADIRFNHKPVSVASLWAKSTDWGKCSFTVNL